MGKEDIGGKVEVRKMMKMRAEQSEQMERQTGGSKERKLLKARLKSAVPLPLPLPSQLCISKFSVGWAMAPNQ